MKIMPRSTVRAAVAVAICLVSTSISFVPGYASGASRAHPYCLGWGIDRQNNSAFQLALWSNQCPGGTEIYASANNAGGIHLSGTVSIPGLSSANGTIPPEVDTPVKIAQCGVVYHAHGSFGGYTEDTPTIQYC